MNRMSLTTRMSLMFMLIQHLEMMPAEVIETESGNGENGRYREHEHQTHASRQGWVTCSMHLIRSRNEPNVPDNPHESDVHARGNGCAHGRRTQFQ